MGAGSNRVLVTGGAGFVGGQLVRALIAAGHQVRVLDDFSTGTNERLAGLPIEIVRADVRSAPAVRRALDGVQVVFHLAAITVEPRAAHHEVLRGEDINVGGTVNLLAQAARETIRRVIIPSSLTVYGKASAYVLHEEVTPEPASPAAVQKLAMEQYARVYRELHGVPSVVVRLARCFGPGERWQGMNVPLVPALCRAALASTPPRLAGEGKQVRDLLYVDNAASGLCAAASAPGVSGDVYNLASGEPLPVVEVWRHIARLAGVDARAVEPELLALPRWEPVEQRVSIARARRDLGWMPPIPVREGLRRTVEHYRQAWLARETAWFAPPERQPEGGSERSSGRSSGIEPPWERLAERAKAGGPMPPPLPEPAMHALPTEAVSELELDSEALIEEEWEGEPDAELDGVASDLVAEEQA